MLFVNVKGGKLAQNNKSIKNAKKKRKKKRRKNFWWWTIADHVKEDWQVIAKSIQIDLNCFWFERESRKSIWSRFKRAKKNEEKKHSDLCWWEIGQWNNLILIETNKDNQKRKEKHK